MKRSVVYAAALIAMLALLASRDGANAQGQPHASGGTMSEFGNSGHYAGEFAGDWYSGGGSSGSCDDGGECGGYGCGDDCDYDYDASCGGAWWNCYGLFGSSERRWFFTADYLYVRASFSEAVAYIEEDISNIDDQRDFVHELNFRHESSYRFGGGYKLNCCDEEIRFMYTRLTSSAEAVAPVETSDNLIFVPYETFSPDSPTFISSDVDVNSFDLDYRKTIPLGGSQCCECGDTCGDCCEPCGCGDACCSAPACPAWDITWSGGVRFADVDWSRSYIAFDDNSEVFRSADATLNFAGGGPRVGLEGRRYFGAMNWCSLFLKGDISVLLGQMEEQIHRTDETGLLTSLTARGRRIIPVTEIEAVHRLKLLATPCCRPAISSAPGTIWASATNLTSRPPSSRIRRTRPTSSASTASSCGWKSVTKYVSLSRLTGRKQLSGWKT